MQTQITPKRIIKEETEVLGENHYAALQVVNQSTR